MNTSRSRARQGASFGRLAPTFTFVGVVVEPRMKLAAAAVAWEATKKKDT